MYGFCQWHNFTLLTRWITQIVCLLKHLNPAWCPHVQCLLEIWTDCMSIMSLDTKVHPKQVACCQLLRRKWNTKINQILRWDGGKLLKQLRQEWKAFDVLLLCQRRHFSPSRQVTWTLAGRRYLCSASQGVKQDSKARCFLLLEDAHSSVCCNAFLLISSSDEHDLLVPEGRPWYLIFPINKGTALLRAACIVLCHWWIWSFRSIESPVFKPWKSNCNENRLIFW